MYFSCGGGARRGARMNYAMRRRALSWVMQGVASLLLSVSAAGWAVASSDSAGAPRRIVSLSPHITELLFAVGAGDRLVGVDAWSDYPPAARDIQRVGDVFALDMERPLALKPDLVVYLQAPLDVLMERIAKRGIKYEQYLERGYLEKLMQAYARFFHDYDAAPLLIVNSAAIDPINNDADYQMLLEEIMKPRRGRHFFNPVGRSLLSNG